VDVSAIVKSSLYARLKGSHVLSMGEGLKLSPNIYDMTTVS